MQGLVGIEDLEVPADNLDGADEDPQMRLRYLRPGDRLEVRTQSFKESWKFQVLSPRSHHRQTDEAEIPIDVDYPPGEEDHFEFFKSVFAGTHEVFAGQPYPWALATSDPAYPAYSLLQDLDTSQATSMASARLDARWVVVHDHRAADGQPVSSASVFRTWQRHSQGWMSQAIGQLSEQVGADFAPSPGGRRTS
ncbi:MAG: hypothetical protein ACXWVS_07135 [Hyphomicrobium sp.]